jgi:hypothetical protein
MLLAGTQQRARKRGSSAHLSPMLSNTSGAHASSAGAMYCLCTYALPLLVGAAGAPPRSGASMLASMPVAVPLLGALSLAAVAAPLVVCRRRLPLSSSALLLCMYTWPARGSTGEGHNTHTHNNNRLGGLQRVAVTARPRPHRVAAHLTSARRATRRTCCRAAAAPPRPRAGAAAAVRPRSPPGPRRRRRRRCARRGCASAWLCRLLQQQLRRRLLRRSQRTRAARLPAAASHQAGTGPRQPLCWR